MKTHFGMMLAFSLLTSLVLVFIVKTGAKERIQYFLYLFGAFIILSLLAGWLMFPFPF
jgi:predicted membrane channel-forming protein YqfA (hemolysin III family)